METRPDREELIKGEAMDSALAEAAEVKKTILTTYKDRDRSAFDQFYETCLNAADPELRELMGKRKKDLADADVARIKAFQKDARRSYRMVCDLMAPEEVEEGKPTKVQKLVDRVALVLDYLRYVGSTALDDEFGRRGISLVALKGKLEDRSPVWADERVRENVRNIFAEAVKVREDVAADTNVILEEIFARAVPQELVYEKDLNPAGLKKGDWSRLVDLKTRLVMAKEGEQKEKAADAAGTLAEEKQFDQERARLMQAKLIALEGEAS